MFVDGGASPGPPGGADDEDEGYGPECFPSDDEDVAADPGGGDDGADVPGAIAYCGENMSFSSILILKKGDQINMRRYNLRGDNLHWY